MLNSLCNFLNCPSRNREKETRKELDTSRIQLIAESDKLHQAESQIHQLEVELSKARSASVQARLRLDEISQRQASRQRLECAGENCKEHCCDSMYKHPSSPHLKAPPSPKQAQGQGAKLPQGRSGSSGRRPSGSCSPATVTPSASREPLQQLVGKENLPAGGAAGRPNGSQSTCTPVTSKRASKRQTVRITSDMDSPGECNQQ